MPADNDTHALRLDAILEALAEGDHDTADAILAMSAEEFAAAADHDDRADDQADSDQ